MAFFWWRRAFCDGSSFFCSSILLYTGKSKKHKKNSLLPLLLHLTLCPVGGLSFRRKSLPNLVFPSSPKMGHKSEFSPHFFVSNKKEEGSSSRQHKDNFQSTVHPSTVQKKKDRSKKSDFSWIKSRIFPRPRSLPPPSSPSSCWSRSISSSSNTSFPGSLSINILLLQLRPSAPSSPSFSVSIHQRRQIAPRPRQGCQKGHMYAAMA